ncbi:MAG: Thiamin-phosphate pyrophosphorylase [Myxococcaceae bacterium]|nr:Thiamin-phosphate pyrophosphorylase [Myxococcaceae bacterium]
MKGLYAIIDPEHCAGRDPRFVAREVLHGGCAALQLRAKLLPDDARLELARELAEACREHGVPFWLNDRVDLGLLTSAAGVHLGQHDLPLADARSLFPRGLLGRSTHSLAQAEAAARAGADVIGFGPIFPTSSKHNPDPCVGLAGLRAVCSQVRCPVIAIGGIELAHASEIAASGAEYAAAIGTLCRATDPRAAARALHRALLDG